MIIQDLQAEILKLKNKLRIEQDARSPTKKYVGEILDQLLLLKDQNEKLSKELLYYKKAFEDMEVRC